MKGPSGALKALRNITNLNLHQLRQDPFFHRRENIISYMLSLDINIAIIVIARGTRAGGQRGSSAPLPSKSGGKGGISVLLTLSTDLISPNFLRTFVLLSGSTSLYPQDSKTCHEMQQWLGAYVCEK